MVRHHWLDPFARQVLRISGQLPSTSIKREDKIEDLLKAIKARKSSSKNNTFLLIDVNRSSPNEWKKLPGCSIEMIELLMRLQKGGVQLSGMEDLSKLLGISKELAESWSHHLEFNWYGNSPDLELNPLLDINYASKVSLKKKLNWPVERLKRLLKERQKKPFDNLADLQERLVLHPSVIEELIGIVSFGPKSAGPELPPKN